MTGRVRCILAGLVVLLLLNAAAFAAEARAGAVAPSVRQPSSLVRSSLLAQLSKQVTLEGFYYDGSVPMLVESMAAVQGNLPIPPDKYVPLLGPLPASFKSGAKVRVSGQVEKPTGDELSGETAAVRVGTASQGTLLQAPVSALATQPIAVLPGAANAPPGGKRYALLIGGGMNSVNNHVRYWNDLWQMYHILVSTGYAPENIRVAYAFGAPRTAGMPVQYPATFPGIAAAFSYFVPRVKAEDTFYLMVSGQGLTPSGAAPASAYLPWLSAPIMPPTFAAQVNRIASYKRMVIEMGQSYSGAFIPFLRTPKRVVITAAAANRDSWAHPSLIYDNFECWYLSALASHFLLGGAALSADANHNGYVSMAEAYSFALPRPGGVTTPPNPPIPPISAQMPQFEDTGTPPSRWGPVPAAGEGVLGAGTNL